MAHEARVALNSLDDLSLTLHFPDAVEIIRTIVFYMTKRAGVSGISIKINPVYSRSDSPCEGRFLSASFVWEGKEFFKLYVSHEIEGGKIATYYYTKDVSKGLWCIKRRVVNGDNPFFVWDVDEFNIKVVAPCLLKILKTEQERIERSVLEISSSVNTN